MRAGIRLIWITACMAVCLSVLHGLAWRGYRKLYAHTYFTLDHVFGKVNADFNTLIVGNSIFKFGVNPLHIDSVKGIRSVNLGYAATGFITQEFLIRTYVQHHSKPGIILLGFSPYTFYTDRELNNKLPMYDYSADTAAARFLEENDSSYMHIKYIPFYKYMLMDDYSRFGIISAYRGTAMFQLPGTYSYNGFYSNRLDSKKVVTFAAAELQEQKVVNRRELEAFYKIVALCNQHNIRLVMVPYPLINGKVHKSSVLHSDVANVLMKVEEQNNVVVLSESDFNFDSVNFSDGTHLTFEGAAKYSGRIAEALRAILSQ